MRFGAPSLKSRLRAWNGWSRVGGLYVSEMTGWYRGLPPAVRQFVDRQHRDAYGLLEAVRHPDTGLYGDAYLAEGPNPEPMCSVAATGVGLIGLAIADQEGWDRDAAGKALQTLQTVTGRHPACRPDRDAKTGFFRHFIHIETGAAWGRSEISTIDTALLVAGALFAASHFGSRRPELGALAAELLESIDWEVAVADPDRGILYMVVEDGVPDLPLPPFNEYVLLAALARRAMPQRPRVAAVWEQVFAPQRIGHFPQRLFRGIPVLTDPTTEEGFLSSFVHQFVYYLVPEYATSPVYRSFYANACLADRLKWREDSELPSYVWGFGAGANDGLYDNYHADAIGRPSGDVASAYIVAGFLPVYPAGIYDLYALYQLHLPYDRYENSDDPIDEGRLRASYRFGLHRFSWRHRNLPNRWYPKKVTVIDWSTMLYGLTAFKWGTSFFVARGAANEAAVAGATGTTPW